MDDASTEDRPSVLGVGGWGTLTVSLVACTIEPTRKGGVQMVIGSDLASPTRAGELNLVVDACTFQLTGNDGADFAIDNLLVVDSEEASVTSKFAITNNAIDSRGASGEGSKFSTGIRIGASAQGISEEEGASVTMPHASTFMLHNEIMGCGGDGLFIQGNEGDYSTLNLQCWAISGNRIHDNGGDGIVIDYAESGSYMRFQTNSNVLYANGNGLVVLNANASGDGQLHFLFDTIADNDDYGVVIEENGQISGFANTINYYNGSGSWHSSGDWDPGDVGSYWETNDWYGYGTYFSPGFVDQSNHNYHIQSGSQCRNAGTNAPLAKYSSIVGGDMDGARRIAENNADIGADEYEP